MDKYIVKKYISLFMVILWMGTIFIFSSQNGSESTGTSNIVVDGIMEVISNTGLIHKEDMETVRETVQFTVRKLAHFSIYMLGGILIYNYMARTNLVRRKALISFVIGAMYAVSDELHQFFIAGRSAEIRDVFIDSTGVLVGVLIIIAIKAVPRKCINKTKRL